MAIKVWAPFSAFTSLEQEMQSLLNRIGARPWMEGFGWKPDTDIFRDDGYLVVQAELPGIDPSDGISVHIEDGVLRIAGEKSEATGVSEGDRYITERRFGSFHRSVMLPDGVDAAAVTAAFYNGLLTVRVPLPEIPPGETGNGRTPIEIAVHP
jgi:HSP20 family protein